MMACRLFDTERRLPDQRGQDRPQLQLPRSFDRYRYKKVTSHQPTVVDPTNGLNKSATIAQVSPAGANGFL